MNWFKSRCTRDNFWNLVFWLGMTIGLFIAGLFGKQYPNAAFIASWSTLIGVPFIVVKGSKVTFTKEEGFFDSKGVSLIGRYPIGFCWMFAASLGILAIIGNILDSRAEKISDEIAELLILGTFFFVNTIYFIHKNCPIAIIFNRHTWLSKIPGVPDRGHYVAPSSSSTQHGIQHSVHTTISTTRAISNSYATGFDRYPSSHSYPGKRLYITLDLLFLVRFTNRPASTSTSYRI